MNLFTKQKQTRTQKTSLWLPQGKVEGGKLEIQDEQTPPTVCKIDKQQGLTCAAQATVFLYFITQMNLSHLNLSHLLLK